MAEEIPEPPELGEHGRRLWDSAWSAGVAWLSPVSDITLVELTCYLVDDLDLARSRYRATSDPADARALAAGERLLHSSLARLGFSPPARSRLAGPLPG